MNFWVKNGIIGIILSVLAYYLLNNYDWLLEALHDSSSSNDVEMTESSQASTSEKEIAAAKPIENTKERENKAAEGLSSFYASLNPDMESGDAPVVRNNVVYLREPTGNINLILEDRIRTVKSISANWQGRVEPRRFKKGDTLYKRLNDYVEESGISLLWWLDKDFIIKSPFRVEKSVIQTAYMVGKSISGHYPEGVNTYFCNRHRTIVITTNPTNYVIENCQLVRSNTSDYEY